MNSFDLKDYTVDPSGKIAKRNIYKDEKIAAFVLNIAKGAQLPPHKHFDSTVLIQVLKGSAEAKVNGNIVPITAGSLLMVEGHELVSVNNTGDETLSMYITLSPNPPSEEYTKDIDI